MTYFSSHYSRHNLLLNDIRISAASIAYTIGIFTCKIVTMYPENLANIKCDN